MAFYSIPMEIYEYTSYIPDGTGKYTEVTSTVSIPHEASIGLIDLSDYEKYRRGLQRSAIHFGQRADAYDW